jgi:hypothetical protein
MIIGGAASIGGALLKKKSSGSTAQNAMGLPDPFQKALERQQQLSQQLIDQGKPLVSKGAKTQTGLIDKYYSPLVYGDRAQSNAVLAPAIDDVNQGYKSLIQQAGQGARGGGMGNFLLDVKQKKANDIARLRFGARDSAAAAMGGLGQGLLTSGTNLQTGGQQGFENVLQALLGERGLQNQMDIARQNRNSSIFGGLGSAAGSILSALILRG